MLFKHKYITEPTLTPEDTIVKALNDLTQALKDRRNKKGMEEIDALKQTDELLHKMPVKPPNAEEHRKQVTFEATTKPPKEMQPKTTKTTNETSTPRVVNNTPTPRVINETPNPKASTTRSKTIFFEGKSKKPQRKSTKDTEKYVHMRPKMVQ